MEYAVIILLLLITVVVAYMAVTVTTAFEQQEKRLAYMHDALERTVGKLNNIETGIDRMDGRR